MACGDGDGREAPAVQRDGARRNRAGMASRSGMEGAPAVHEDEAKRNPNGMASRSGIEGAPAVQRDGARRNRAGAWKLRQSGLTDLFT